MGMGDDILATVQARALYQATGHKVRPTNYWSPVWDGNPCFQHENGPAIDFQNKPGNRPYILAQTADRFIWNPNYRAVPGELYVNEHCDSEKVYGRWIIEPNVKGTISSDNKDWGFDRWQQVAYRSNEALTQLGSGPWLGNVARIETATFVEAVAYLRGAAGFIGTDGGLHHAAAALGIPAIVIWGGFVSPDLLGYDSHINLWSGARSCGSKASCAHCREAMLEVSVDEVVECLNG